MPSNLDEDAIKYHRAEPAGKLSVNPTKPMATQRDLSLAYSPGVAAACNEIVRDAAEAYNMTGRGNLVGVITNGTAVLGLGAIGALASKPVMEGKAALFKKFSDINVFDIEVDETDPQMFIETVARLEPTFGGINLEDIKAPECFVIEQTLKERMNIPVFHDDQHGTAIVAGAAIYNALRIVDKDISKIKLVTSGAGAAALSCLDILVSMGLPKENITVTDIVGVVYEGREELMDPYKSRYARQTDARKLDDVIADADIFLGLSAPNVLTADMVKKMAPRPFILALANPVPEIMPDVAMAARPDAIMATGRSDYPNQVNNVLCFPFIFRGALDVGATTINEEMKIACLKALADLAMAEASDKVRQAYGDQPLNFGADYLIPKPFDPRLLSRIGTAVAQAAMDSGVATRPITDMEAYRLQLSRFAYRTSGVMSPVVDRAKENPKRVVFAEGETTRVLMACQQAVDEGIAKPILVGRPQVINREIEELALRLKDGEDITIIDPNNNPEYDQYVEEYLAIMGRRGSSPEEARSVMANRGTAIASIILNRGDADAMICGSHGRFRSHLQHIRDLVGLKEGVHDLSTVSLMTLPTGTFFLCDTHISENPTAEEITEMTIMAIDKVRHFGILPKVALLASSNFGTNDLDSSIKMRKARNLLCQQLPDVQIDGEMHADAAISEDLRRLVMPESNIKGQSNLLVMPNLDSANIAFGLLRTLGGGIAVGPVMLGTKKPAHILSSSTTVRGIYNMIAVAVSDAQTADK